MEFTPFSNTMIPEASLLLAERHRRSRTSFHELPARFEDPQCAARALESLLSRENANGYAVRRAGKLAAFLIGETSIQPWGRSGYVHLPGYGLSEYEDPQLLQDLYARLGEDWVQKGCFNHYAYVCSADEEIVSKWFDLGFGKEREDALLDMRAVDFPESETPPGIEIRRAGEEDKHHLASLSDIIWRHQTRAPRWHPMTPEETRKQTEGWAEIAETASDLAYLAFDGKKVCGSIAFFSEDERDDDLTIPPRCRYITAAATREAARGRGIGTALTWIGLKSARADGADYCLTNWQSANLLAARFWVRFGFRVVAYRLARRIHPDIAWAKG